MARPNKVGLDYYNTDTSRYQDIKIKKLNRAFNTIGICVYDYLVSEIYRVKGCFIEWDEDTVFNVADYYGLKESTVNEVVNYCGAVGLFNKELLTNGRVLTSLSIQLRYANICIASKRKDWFIPALIKLIPEGTKLIQEITRVNSGGSTQRKGKESKVKEREKESPPEFSDVITPEFLEMEFKNNDEWNMIVCRDLKINSERKANLQVEFIKEIRLKEKFYDYRNLRDAKGHFISWAKLRLAKEVPKEEQSVVSFLNKYGK